MVSVYAHPDHVSRMLSMLANFVQHAEHAVIIVCDLNKLDEISFYDLTVVEHLQSIKPQGQHSRKGGRPVPLIFYF